MKYGNFELKSTLNCDKIMIVIINNINFLVFLFSDRANVPPAEPLPNDNQDTPYFMIGDNAFALKTWLLKPYPHRDQVDPEMIFNYRLSRARRAVECTFGQLANR